MTVSAFHLGLFEKTKELEILIKNDKSLYNNGYNAVELRKQLVCRELPSYIDTDGLYELAGAVLDLCKVGLVERGFGEEIYLAPLYERIEKRTNPAGTMLERLKNGMNINEIVIEYGRI